MRPSSAGASDADDERRTRRPGRGGVGGARVRPGVAPGCDSRRSARLRYMVGTAVIQVMPAAGQRGPPRRGRGTLACTPRSTRRAAAPAGRPPAVDVEQGHDLEAHVVGGQPQAGRHRTGRRDQVGPGQRHGLGAGGGAAGVQQQRHRRVERSAGSGRRPGRAPTARAAPARSPPGRSRCSTATPARAATDTTGSGQAGRPRRRRPAHHDDGPQPEVGQLEGQLGRGQRRVQGGRRGHRRRRPGRPRPAPARCLRSGPPRRPPPARARPGRPPPPPPRPPTRRGAATGPPPRASAGRSGSEASSTKGSGTAAPAPRPGPRRR